MGRTWTGLTLLALVLLLQPAGAALGATRGVEVFSYQGEEQVLVVPQGGSYLELAAAGADGGSKRRRRAQQGRSRRR